MEIIQDKRYEKYYKIIAGFGGDVDPAARFGAEEGGS